MRNAIASLLMGGIFLAGQGPLIAVEAGKQAPCQIIPRPQRAEYLDGGYQLTERTVIYARSDKLKATAQYLAELLRPATGLILKVASPRSMPSGGVVLKLDDSRVDLGEEGYLLHCTPKGVTITAATPSGVFYGVQTLRQLLPPEIEGRQTVEGRKWIVPSVSIEDRPRFKWRGYMLDPARHFLTKEDLKRYIDLMALQKLNILQLHLTDDQGWRIEIKKYPKLTEVGSRSNHSRKSGDGWFYSQADIKEVVAYATSRHVTVVPEIEMPGHSGAAIRAYPELGCTGKPVEGWSAPLCVSKDSTFEYVTDVLDEVIALFPSPYIHVGADEVPAEHWRKCPRCTTNMERLAGEKLPDDVNPFRVKVDRKAGTAFHKDVGLLQGQFVRKVDKSLASKGRRMVGWDEIIESGLQRESRAVMMVWRSPHAIVGAVSQKRNLVISIFPDYYLDNGLSLKRTYDYEPVPAELSAEDEKYILGIQGNMWGEGTPSIRRVDMQSFPRLCAIAETGWSSRERRNFDDFSVRLSTFYRRLDLLGVHRKSE